MKVFSLLLFSLSVSAGYCQQCTLTIKQIGAKNDTVLPIEATFQDIEPERINDSVLKYSFSPSQPHYLAVVIDYTASPYWLAPRAWIDPKTRPQRTLTIDYNKHTAVWDMPLMAFDTILRAVAALDEKRLNTTTEAEGDKYQKSEDSIAYVYAKTHPSSFLSLWFFTHGFGRSLDRKTRLELFKTLNPALQEYPEYSKVLASLKGKRTPKIGEQFKEFIAELPDGKTFNTATIKGKWVLLEFWFTGCSPCVKGIDDFVNAYKATDRNKVEFISISLDEKKENWQKSIVTKKMLWPSVWLPDAFYADLVMYYNVSAYPFYVLFNPDKKLDLITFGAEELPMLKEKLIHLK